MQLFILALDSSARATSKLGRVHWSKNALIALKAGHAFIMLLLLSISQPLLAQSSISQTDQAPKNPNLLKSWNDVSAPVKSCINTAYSKENVTVDQMVAVNIAPDDQRILPTISYCIQTMAIELKKDFSCKVQDTQGQITQSTCQQNFAKIVNGVPTAISRDDAIKSSFRGEKVQVSTFPISKGIKSSEISNAINLILPKDAKWEKMPPTMFPHYIDVSGMFVGPKWREYSRIFGMKSSVKVGNSLIEYDYEVFREIASCPYRFDQYHVLLAKLYFKGKSPNNKLVHYELMPRGTYQPNPQKADIDFICSIKKAGSYDISAENMKYISEVRRDHAPILADLKKQRQREDTENANRPRGYYMVCQDKAVPADMNIKTVNCSSPGEVKAALRWAWNAIRAERPDFAKTCIEAIYQIEQQSSAEVIRQASPGALGRCNTGLGFLSGPSRVQAGAPRK
jgi:hypothetical protein